MKPTTFLPYVLALSLTGWGTAVFAQSGTAGTAGSAAAGGTSASTVGTGGTSTGAAGTSSSIGSGGSAAGGRATSDTKIHGNQNNLHGSSRAKAQDGGTWSKSSTKTKVKAGESVRSRTKSMAHEPGSRPVKSRTSTTSNLPQ